jgi:uncharacterized membrane protein
MRAFLARPAHWLPVSAWLGLAVIGLLGLITIALVWHAWLAPAPVWLTLKSLPLLIPLRGLLHGRRNAAQWAALLALPYFLGSLAGVYGYWAEPRFTPPGDFVPYVVQLAASLALIIGTSFYAFLMRYQAPREG